MISVSRFGFLLCWWHAISGTVYGQNAPTNLTHVIATNNCVTAVSLKWIQPDASWEVHNYIIAYWTKQYGTNTTVKTETLLTTDSNKTKKNVAISGSFIDAHFKVAANFSSGNQSDSRRFWSNTIVVTILKTDCSPIDGGDGLRGTMYVVKLTAIIVGALLGMIIIFFLALRIYVWRKERRYDQNDLSQKERRSHHLMLIEHELPVSTDTFFDHVSAMKFQHSQGFNSEWARLKEPSSQAFSFGNRSSNSAKNRYANVPTFDSTRVALLLQNGKHDTTYINANFVDGIEKPKAYIATQAPLPETISDFWRMVWEQEVSYIVMIVNTKEQDDTACCKYWPEESEHEYGKVIVKIMDAAKYADYCIRRFEVRRIGSEESRMVWQFQYHSWPTKNAVPVHPTSFLEFVKTVAFFSINNTHPIVVHCSSGNGRTGVFIVVDSQLKRIKMQNNINIFYNVDSTRHQRYKIIRNVEEYIFIHECILDHVTCMNRNDILPRDLEDYINEQKSSFSNEFQKELSDAMNDTTGMHSKSNVAKLPQNIPKNRFENILPFDHSRVKLRRNDSLTSDGHDYINASYCSGLRRQRNYIITQSPMESTVFDFWCMVWENSSFTIAMLLQQEEVSFFHTVTQYLCL